jgi:hypothetical protein
MDFPIGSVALTSYMLNIFIIGGPKLALSLIRPHECPLGGTSWHKNGRNMWHAGDTGGRD